MPQAFVRHASDQIAVGGEQPYHRAVSQEAPVEDPTLQDPMD